MRVVRSEYLVGYVLEGIWIVDGIANEDDVGFGVC
jgi:hypothetical protein